MAERHWSSAGWCLVAGSLPDGFGGTAVFVVGSSGVLFNTNSPDVSNLQDSDFTLA